jgi:hypothetical protein
LQVSTTVYEILSNRSLFNDFRIIRVFAKVCNIFVFVFFID